MLMAVSEFFIFMFSHLSTKEQMFALKNAQNKAF